MAVYRRIDNCKSRAEAIERSGFYIGQLAKVVDLMVTGNTDGVWTVHPIMEFIQTEDVNGKIYSTVEARRRGPCSLTGPDED